MNPKDAWTELCAKLDAQNAHLETIAAQLGSLRQTRAPEHQFDPFTITTQGWNQIVPQQPTRIAVHAIVIIATGAVNVTLGQGSSAGDAGAFPSSNSVSGGTLALVANSGFSESLGWPSFLFATEPNKGFFLNLDVAVQVGGFVTYSLLYHPTEAGS